MIQLPKPTTYTAHKIVPTTETLRAQPVVFFVRETAAIEMNGENGNNQNVARLKTAKD